MAIVDRAKPVRHFGDLKVVSKDVDGPASYVQGTGTLLNASDFGLSVIEFFTIGNPVVTATQATTHYVDAWMINPNKGAAQQGSTQIRVLWSVFATGAEVAGAVNLSGQSFEITAFGY
jgi:hypothetical protein